MVAAASTRQQLLSLMAVLDKGIITQDQYAQQKAVIFKNSKQIAAPLRLGIVILSAAF